LLLDVGDLVAAEQLLLPVVDDANADLALEGGDVLGEVLENRGAGERWAALIEQLGTRAGEAGPRGLRALGRARALWFNTRVQHAEATAAAHAALEGAERDWEIQRGAQRLAFAAMIGGDMVEARRAARLSVEHARERSYLRARALRTLAIVAGNSDDGPAALAAAEEEVALVRRSGQSARLAIALGDLGYALESVGRVDEARETHQASIRAARQLGLEGPALYAEFRLLGLELVNGAPGLVTEERIHSFADRADRAGLELLALARRPMVAWLDSTEGRLKAAYDALVDLDFLDRFPRFHYLGECLEGIGVRLAAGAGSGDAVLNAAARHTLERGEAYWQGVGNRRRAARCRELVEGLE
jgi:tetratricopeptide (TPR) repeat protein